MTNGTWVDKLTQIAEDAEHIQEDNSVSGLSQGERHRSILRQQTMLALSGVLIPYFQSGEKSMDQVSKEIESVIEAMVVKATKDGLDLDDELLDDLADASGKMIAISEEWHEVKLILSQTN
jgi:hypothetical protein